MRPNPPISYPDKAGHPNHIPDAGGPSKPSQVSNMQLPARPAPTPASASKLAKNKKLPATMITPSGHIEESKKPGARDKAGQVSRKKRLRMEKGARQGGGVEWEAGVEGEGKGGAESESSVGLKAVVLRFRAAWTANGSGKAATSQEGVGVSAMVF